MLAEGACWPQAPSWWPSGSGYVCASRSVEGYESNPLTLSASVGSLPRRSNSAQDCSRRRHALYTGRRLSGKNRCESFDPAMQSERYIDRLELKMDLQSALAHDEFFLLFSRSSI